MNETGHTAAIEIVLTEDNDTDVMLVREALKKHRLNFNLQVFPDGEKTLLYFDHLAADDTLTRPDIMLLDLNTPRGSSSAVLRRSKMLCPDCIVVITSASDSPADRASAVELGADHYFRKPVDLDEFLKLGAVVKDLLPGAGSDSNRRLPG